jgi:hypothetical protein
MIIIEDEDAEEALVLLHPTLVISMLKFNPT